jgi:glyoxylase-like metal-dependent hydrolase (beta-lactamase superfamily II)
MSDYPEHEYEEEFDLAKQAAWELEQEHLRELEEYYQEEFDDPEPFDPATEVVETIDIDTIITNDGRILVIEICIFADGHTEDHQYYLEDSCDEPPDRLSDIPF